MLWLSLRIINSIVLNVYPTRFYPWILLMQFSKIRQLLWSALIWFIRTRCLWLLLQFLQLLSPLILLSKMSRSTLKLNFVLEHSCPITKQVLLLTTWCSNHLSWTAPTQLNPGMDSLFCSSRSQQLSAPTSCRSSFKHSLSSILSMETLVCPLTLRKYTERLRQSQIVAKWCSCVKLVRVSVTYSEGVDICKKSRKSKVASKNPRYRKLLRNLLGSW